MKTAIIYSTSNKITLKAAKILADKLKCSTRLISIEKAKTACLLKYDFIILAGSINRGKVQSSLRTYVSRNMKTLMDKPVGLFICCVEDNKAKKYLNNSFSKELVSSSFISSNFGYDLDLKKGNMISRKISNNLLSASKKEGKEVPMLKLNEIEKFANNINILNEKRIKTN